MKRSYLPWLVINSLLLAWPVAWTSARPRYGGTARVLVRHKIASLDPLVESEYPADRDRIGSLVFETLTEIDAQGELQARLAGFWQVEPDQRAWRFQLRLANFHDGSVVTAQDAAASLKAANPGWKITPQGKQALMIETPSPVPHLPELLSLPRFTIVKRLADHTLAGSGPYKFSEWQPEDRALLTAFEDYWGGRPYPDALEFQMGHSLREHLMERFLGTDHAAEVDLDQVAALEQAGQTVAISRPADLLVMVFLHPGEEKKPVSGAPSARAQSAGTHPVDRETRQAVSAAIGRTAISDVLLRKKSAPAYGLLPQWLTGYEFVFAPSLAPPPAPSAGDATNAATRGPRLGAGAPSILLAYDYSDSEARMAAERIAVDAREAGILIQPYGDVRVNSRSARAALHADAALLRLRLRSLDPAAALAGLAEDLEFSPEISLAVLNAAGPEQRLSAERQALEDYRLVPVAHVCEALWLGSGAHQWRQLPQGDWKLGSLWVEGAR